MAVEFFDRYSRGKTWCHRLSPRLKIVATLGVILSAALLPISLWPVHGCLASLVFAAHSLAGIPLGYLVRRVSLFVPLLTFMALAVPLARGFAGGWELAATVFVRALVAFLAGLWLVNTTPFDRLLVAARGLGMPRAFAAALSFMYRYLFVLFDEMARMRAAQRARTFGRLSLWHQWRTSTQLLGSLLIRALNRAERIHGAMCSRGWTGDVRTLE
jgi:cobalt/nickel transport system permease protein